MIDDGFDQNNKQRDDFTPHIQHDRKLMSERDVLATIPPRSPRTNQTTTMHGRRRKDYKAMQRDPKVMAKLASKAVAWNQLQTELLARQSQTDGSEDTQTTLQLLEKALAVNPDPLWLWNFRRTLLNENELFDWELEARVTQAALESNPKAYGAWHHRKWSLQQQTATKSKETAAAELQLTAAFFLRDERNFHCWSYRRYVVSHLLHGPNATGAWRIHTTTTTTEGEDNTTNTTWMGPQLASSATGEVAAVATPRSIPLSEALPILQAEWDFTEQKIRDNFSNFSAFHYRSQLYPLMLLAQEQQVLLLLLLQPEFELIANAVCTEPDDQTAWWYQAFVLQTTAAADDDDVLPIVLADHIELLRELRTETESKSKWVLLGLLQCLERQSSTSTSGNTAERRELLQTLVVLDADRSQRYRDLLQELESDTKPE